MTRRQAAPAPQTRLTRASKKQVQWQEPLDDSNASAPAAGLTSQPADLSAPEDSGPREEPVDAHAAEEHCQPAPASSMNDADASLAESSPDAAAASPAESFQAAPAAPAETPDVAAASLAESFQAVAASPAETPDAETDAAAASPAETPDAGMSVATATLPPDTLDTLISPPEASVKASSAAGSAVPPETILRIESKLDSLIGSLAQLSYQVNQLTPLPAQVRAMGCQLATVSSQVANLPRSSALAPAPSMTPEQAARANSMLELARARRSAASARDASASQKPPATPPAAPAQAAPRSFATAADAVMTTQQQERARTNLEAALKRRQNPTPENLAPNPHVGASSDTTRAFKSPRVTAIMAPRHVETVGAAPPLWATVRLGVAAFHTQAPSGQGVRYPL